MRNARTAVICASAALFIAGVGAAMAHGGRTRDDRMDSHEFYDMMSARPDLSATVNRSDDPCTYEADVKDAKGGLFGHFFVDGNCKP